MGAGLGAVGVVGGSGLSGSNGFAPVPILGFVVAAVLCDSFGFEAPLTVMGLAMGSSPTTPWAMRAATRVAWMTGSLAAYEMGSVEQWANGGGREMCC